MFQVKKGTLEIVDGCNAYYLYGELARSFCEIHNGIATDTDAGDVVMLACLGTFKMSPYDPNEDHDLPEAYHFTVIS